MGFFFFFLLVANLFEKFVNECLVDTRFSSFRTIETTIETRYRGQFF